MEEQLSSLEQRVKAVEQGQGHSEETEKALRAYQVQMSEKLRRVRDLLQAESGAGDSSEVARERDAALEENKKLRKEVERLNYRVKHLVRALNEEENKK